MSLPEVLLILREDHRRESAKALLALRTEALAAFAVWDKDAGRKLAVIQGELQKSINVEYTEFSGQLQSVFAQWGAKIEKHT